MKCKRVHHKKEPYDVFIARPSKWGSPFSYKENSTAPYKVANRKGGRLVFSQKALENTFLNINLSI